ncbi:MAG: UDP-N-acetylmuramate--L-alanine ligase [Chloroflexi bacterium CFX4]|nr:UDP-N-acetylmuramate--L-alanine ligase [Chloroflexi bacterium CFX4]MDL1923210.1 UDP-N-acetylmuramate--L-alanine ligase [Chloroflexi bacterium CFX3]
MSSSELTAAHFQSGAHVHIVGIGGAGMSAIARVLIGRGVRVSGSDRALNAQTDALAALGARIYEGHAAANLNAPNVVLISSAVSPENSEVEAATARGIPVLRRREALPLLLGDSLQIAVAGTHGKTTTTALIAHLLRETGRDPSYIVGSTLLNSGDNARHGTGDAFVIEADEYDYMFLGLTPTIAVLTNLEHDHPDMFPTFAAMQAAFQQFIQRIPEYDGVLIACADDPQALRLAKARRSGGQPTLTYGIHTAEADWRATLHGADRLVIEGVQDGQPVRAESKLPIYGDHNAQNSLAALAATSAYGVPLAEAAAALPSFRGTARRFEVMGETRGVTVINDYAHHPTAIRATLQAVRARYPTAEVWAVWQPHTYSRTRLLLAAFIAAFGAADHVLITDIYGAREQPQAGDPTAADLAAMLREQAGCAALHSGDLIQTAAFLAENVRAGSVVILFSAGSAPQIGERLLAALAGVS